MVKTSKAAGSKIQRAQALLKCDQGSAGPGWIDDEIAEAFGGPRRSVENWRKQAVEEALGRRLSGLGLAVPGLPAGGSVVHHAEAGNDSHAPTRELKRLYPKITA